MPDESESRKKYLATMNAVQSRVEPGLSVASARMADVLPELAAFAVTVFACQPEAGLMHRLEVWHPDWYCQGTSNSFESVRRWCRALQGLQRQPLILFIFDGSTNLHQS
jgi:hypothetical protein